MLYMRLFYPISIHAPTRGATNLLLLWPLPPEISIHAPTRGATQPYLHPVSLFRNFNPRSHEGSDDVTLKTPLLHSAISIHAPTRGATDQHKKPFCIHEISIHAPTRGATMHWHLSSSITVFQSTLPRGERLVTALVITVARSFQSTLPRGERQRKPMSLWLHKYFNPRSHEGSDGDETRAEYMADYISIHAPTRGATRVSSEFPGTKKFQSTLPRGERRNRSGVDVARSGFQSTLPRGERPPEPEAAGTKHQKGFQSTLPRGERP